MLTIDLAIARRFILGKQGLWPGRRWQGAADVQLAMEATEYLQLDPLQVVARSHDLQLHSRVLGYTPGLWEEVTYTERNFFDWGGWLATRPMAELPHWRVVMARERDGDPDCDPRVHKMLAEHADAVADVRTLLQERGTVSNRDFAMGSRTRTQNYRGRKDSSLALYYLWRAGEVMTHHRENFERVYALAEGVAPSHLLLPSSRDESDRFLIKKEISFLGLSRLQRTADAFHRGVPFSKGKELLSALIADGEVIEVKVDGWRPIHYVLAADEPLLADLCAGRVPEAWRPLAATTEEEVIFLAPLDPVSARGRAKILFDFDYVWEVYKPEHERKFGYYTMPILWGDRLVARFDSKFDRTTNCFHILGLWLEAETLGHHDTFAAALTRGFARMLTFLGATAVDTAAISQSHLRQSLERGL